MEGGWRRVGGGSQGSEGSNGAVEPLFCAFRPRQSFEVDALHHKWVVGAANAGGSCKEHPWHADSVSGISQAVRSLAVLGNRHWCHRDGSLLPRANGEPAQPCGCESFLGVNALLHRAIWRQRRVSGVVLLDLMICHCLPGKALPREPIDTTGKTRRWILSSAETASETTNPKCT